MSQNEKKLSRRRFVKYAGGAVVVAAAAAAGYGIYETTRPPAVTPTMTAATTSLTSMPTQTAAPEIAVLLVDQPSFRGAEKYTPEFEQQTGIKVRIEFVPYETYLEKIIMDFAAHTGAYDVACVDSIWIGPMASGGHLEPLKKWLDDPRIAAEVDVPDFLPTHLDLWGTWDGEIVALPWTSDVAIMIYNKELFDKEGINYPDPTGQITWDQLHDYAAMLTKDTSGDGKIDQYGSALTGIRDDPVYMEFLFRLFSFGGENFENRKPIFNSPEGVDALQHMLDLRPFCSPGPTAMNWEDTLDQFMNGKIAMVQMWDSLVGDIENPDTSKVAGKCGYCTNPSQKIKAANMAGWTVGMSRDSKNKDAAFRYIQWLTSKETIRKLAYDGFVATPARNSLLEDPKIVERAKWLPTTLESLRIGKGPPRMPEYGAFLSIIGKYLSQAVDGTLSAKEALDGAHDEVAALIK